MCCEHEGWEHDGRGRCTSPGCFCIHGERLDLEATPTLEGPTGEESYDDPEGGD